MHTLLKAICISLVFTIGAILGYQNHDRVHNYLNPTPVEPQEPQEPQEPHDIVTCYMVSKAYDQFSAECRAVTCETEEERQHLYIYRPSLSDVREYLAPDFEQPEIEWPMCFDVIPSEGNQVLTRWDKGAIMWTLEKIDGKFRITGYAQLILTGLPTVAVPDCDPGCKLDRDALPN